MIDPKVLQKLREQHEAVFHEIITKNQYHVSEPDLKDKVILDIGANTGIFSVLANDYGAKRIIAIESNPASFKVLCDNVKDFNNVTVINKAASSISDKKVRIGKESFYGNIDGRCYVVPDEKGNVDTISINDILSEIKEESIVLKLDCEGSEYNILYSIDQNNFDKVSEILLEAHDGIGPAPKIVGVIDKLVDYIKGRGFKIINRDSVVGTIVQMFKFEREENTKDDITVLISGFARPEYLKPQIEALNNQTIKPDKIIVLYTKPNKDFKVPFMDGADFIVVEDDQGLNTRFAVGLIAKTKYVCITDDDLIPGKKWLETCLNASKREDAIICGYGVRYNEAMDEASSRKFGDHGEKNEALEEIDMAGHCWFLKKEWLKYFWMEEPLDWTVSDDMHLSYTIKKYIKIRLLVSPHPENNKEIWSNIRPELGLGKKALHARKEGDLIADSNDWGDKDIPELKSRLNEFLEKRKILLEKYNKLKDNYITPVTVNPTAFDKVLLPDVTCIISTKDRYFSTLPYALIAICNQTHKPKELIIYDDSKNKKDLRGEFIYNNIFSLISFYGIQWSVIYTNEEGQVANHNRSLSKSSTDIIYRLDDDEIPEPTVLEKLLKNIKPDVGAVGGLVIPSNAIKPIPSIASNKIEDIYMCLNEQWYVHPHNKEVKEVDHLYSSFVYRKSIAEYCMDLSVVGHREESILTYDIKRKGYKVLIDPSAITWHWRNPEGGLRSNNDVNNFSHDEHIFQKKMSSWGVKANDYKYVVLENGIGDHFAFKSILPQFLKKYPEEKKIFFTAFPSVFEDMPDLRQASIADALISFDNIEKYGIYKWMIDQNWKGNLPGAFAKMYNVELSPVKSAKAGDTTKDSTIIISPYSYMPSHAKSYPFWKELIPKIKTLGYKLVQIGMKGEVPLEGMDDYLWNISFKDLEEKIKTCTCWISVDNFLQHMVNCMEEPIKGIVLWGISDPTMFGYDYNTNILKDRKYLREDQFGVWKNIVEDEKTKVKKDVYVPQNKNSFENPSEVFKIIGRVIGSNGYQS
jgi:FkbM family methyltransferase